MDSELIQEILNHYYFCENISLRFEDRPEIESVSIIIIRVFEH